MFSCFHRPRQRDERIVMRDRVIRIIGLARTLSIWALGTLLLLLPFDAGCPNK
jgi:hypothetical protein